MIEEIWLAGVVTFGARTVEAAEQLVEPMIRSSQLAITLLHRRHQFTDQAVAARYIGWHLNVKRHGFLHHAPETRDAMKKFLEKIKEFAFVD